MTQRKISNFSISSDTVFLLLLGIMFSLMFIKSLEYTNTLGMFPKYVSLLASVLVIYQLTLKFFCPDKLPVVSDDSKEQKQETGIAWQLSFVVVGIYIAAIYMLGFIIATLILSLVFPYLLGKRKWWYLALFSLATTVIVVGVFEVILDIRLPVSVFLG